MPPFFLLLVISPFLLPISQAQPSSYIISLHTYHPLSDQFSLLRSLLPFTPPTHYALLPRPNLSPILPTDFLLVQTFHPAILTRLRSSPQIRSIHPQQTHLRSPKAITRHQTPDESLTSHPTLFAPVIHPFNAGALWRRGITGNGVTVAVFDTGLLKDETYFANNVIRTDWTGENTTADTVGHGTFVAGLIAATHPACPGLAPGVQLHLFRVFTGAQVSYTSWFLDAFNYAIHIGVDLLNLSVGGPDFADLPFMEKVDELSANGIVVVSAIGNDGPLWGSLNNPADMMAVVGVGGVEPDGSVADFSSRGMTMHEVGANSAAAYGRVKPDLVAYARDLVAPSHKGVEICRKLSGTSVASPVVTGAIALLMSAIPKERRKRVLNPASVKLLLARSCHRLRKSPVYEQGAGLLDIEDAYQELLKLDAEFVKVIEETHRATPPTAKKTSAANIKGPTAGLFPAFYDLTREGCPYMWPHCAQAIYPGGMGTRLNVTLLNPGGAEARVENITWVQGRNARFVTVLVYPPPRFWPWAAGMGIHLRALASQTVNARVRAKGVLKMTIVTVHKGWYSDVELPIQIDIVPVPKREKRLLWDVFHSIQYPPGYVPRDSLLEEQDKLDWLGDHPHTNFHELYRSLLKQGFYVDVLDGPLTCLSRATLDGYGGILLFDSEDYFSKDESTLIEWLVKERGVALIVAAEWYNLEVMHSLLFEDDNTRSWWSPVVAGANVPGLNEILGRFGIGLGDAVVSGVVGTNRGTWRFESGVPIVKFPAMGELLYVPKMKVYEQSIEKKRDALLANGKLADVAVMGLTKAGRGAVLVYGDSNCIDTAYRGDRCYDAFAGIVEHAIGKCAMAERCEKLFGGESIVIEGELRAVAEGIGRLARQPGKVDLDLFRPHSKVLGMKEGDGEVCAMGTRGWVSAKVEVSKDRDMELPGHRKAEPLGSERRYFESLQGGWGREWEGGNGGVFLSSFKMRSFVSIGVGILLVFVSVALRYQRQKRKIRGFGEGGSSELFYLSSSVSSVVDMAGRKMGKWKRCCVEEP